MKVGDVFLFKDVGKTIPPPRPGLYRVTSISVPETMFSIRAKRLGDELLDCFVPEECVILSDIEQKTILGLLGKETENEDAS